MATEYKELPCGYYNVKIEACERMTSKGGNPMLQVKARVADGEHKGRLHFIYQMTKSEVGAGIADNYLKYSMLFKDEVLRMSKYEKASGDRVYTNYRFYLTDEQQARFDAQFGA